MVKKSLSLDKKLEALRTLGFFKDMEEELAKRVRTVNTINLILSCLIVIIGSLFFYMTKSFWILIPATIEFLLVNMTLYLNAKHQFHLSSILTYGIQCAAVVYFGLLLEGYVDLQLMVIWLFSIVPMLFTHKRTRRIAFMGAVFTLVLLEAARYAPPFFDPIPINGIMANIFRECSVAGVVALIVLVSQPYIIEYDRSQLLQKLMRFKQHIFGAINHDLRTPVGIVEAIGNSLREDLLNLPDVNPNSIKSTQQLLSAACQMKNIVENTMAMTELELCAKRPMIEEDFDLVDKIREIVLSHEPLFDQSGQTLKLTIRAGNYWVKGDQQALALILSNLLGNANKYGFPETAVVITVKINSDGLTVSISNRSETIPDHVLQRIGKAFNGKRHNNVKSSGLGLHNVQEYISLLNGSWTITSVNELTTTTFNIPLKKSSKSQQAITSNKKSIVVYFADDNKYWCTIAEQKLSNRGMIVQTYPDGQQLLNALKKGDRPDIVISDTDMPKMGGIALIEAIKTIPELRHIPTIRLGTRDNKSKCLSDRVVYDKTSWKEIYFAINKLLVGPAHSKEQPAPLQLFPEK